MKSCRGLALFHITFLGRFICHSEKIITGKKLLIFCLGKGFRSFQGGTGLLLLLTMKEASPLLQHHTFTYLNSHVLGFSRYISDIQGAFQNLKWYFLTFGKYALIPHEPPISRKSFLTSSYFDNGTSILMTILVQYVSINCN